MNQFAKYTEHKRVDKKNKVTGKSEMKNGDNDCQNGLNS